MTSLTQEEFIASDGRKITLEPGWFELKTEWPLGLSFEAYANNIGQEDEYPVNNWFFLNKLMTADAMYRLLLEHGFSPFDGPMLDLCTGPAILPRAFKAMNICKESYGIDIKNRLEECSDDRLKQLWETLPYTINRGEGEKIFDVYVQMSEAQTGLNNIFSFLGMDFDASRLSMDGYVEGDFLNYSPNLKFPLVTLMGGLCFFDPSSFFAKLSEIMTPGGIFATFNDYFYQVWGGAHLPMDAPWLHARLTKDDFLRYYETVRPGILEPVKKAFYSQSPHNTVVDFLKEARKHGFEPVAFHRLFDKQVIKPVLFETLESMNKFYKIILKDCLSVNPTVVPEDLFASILIMVLRKAT